MRWNPPPSTPGLSRRAPCRSRTNSPAAAFICAARSNGRDHARSAAAMTVSASTPRNRFGTVAAAARAAMSSTSLGTSTAAILLPPAPIWPANSHKQNQTAKPTAKIMLPASRKRLPQPSSDTRTRLAICCSSSFAPSIGTPTAHLSLPRTASRKRRSTNAGPIPNIRASGSGTSTACRSCRTGCPNCSRPSATDILSSLPKARARSTCCAHGASRQHATPAGRQVEAGA